MLSICFPVTIQWGEIEAIALKNNCISATPIPKITTLFQNNGRPVIKTWEKNREHKFLKYLDKPFVKAIDKLQATRFVVNKDVHEAIAKHWDLFVKHEVFDGKDQSENDKLYQRQASKNREVKGIMATAERWLDKEFSFYIDADYRGRLYYSEPFFNFQGADIARSQLLFAKGKPFDESANFWLAVHTA